MKLIRKSAVVVLALVMAVVSTPDLRAQAPSSTITATDIQRLQDALQDAGRDISEARARDNALGSQLEKELDTLSDDTAYLRVKLRRSESVPRTEYFDLRDRIDEAAIDER